MANMRFSSYKQSYYSQNNLKETIPLKKFPLTLINYEFNKIKTRKHTLYIRLGKIKNVVKRFKLSRIIFFEKRIFPISEFSDTSSFSS